MNKQKFIDYLRSQENLTEGQLEDLNKSLADFPYFSIGRSIAAKASKDLSLESKGSMTATAAIYSTDRKHLKKYINGEVIFLTGIPTVSDGVVGDNVEAEKELPVESSSTEQAVVETKEIIPVPPAVNTDAPTNDSSDKQGSVIESQENKSQATSEIDLKLNNLKAPSGEDVDQMLDELQHDMSELKKSREHFVDIQNQIEEEEAFSAALRRASEKAQEVESEQIAEPKKKLIEKVESKVDEAKPSETVPKDSKDGEKSDSKKSSQKEKISEIEAKESKAIEKNPEIKTKIKDEPSILEPKLSKSSKPGVVTNFEIANPDEEDDDFSPVISKIDDEKSPPIKKESKKPKASKSESSSSTQSSRTKIKRSDLDKAMSGSVKTPEKSKAPSKNLPSEKKTDSKAKSADPKTIKADPKTKSVAPKLKKVDPKPKEAEPKAKSVEPKPIKEKTGKVKSKEEAVQEKDKVAKAVKTKTVKKAQLKPEKDKEFEPKIAKAYTAKFQKKDNVSDELKNQDKKEPSIVKPVKSQPKKVDPTPEVQKENAPQRSSPKAFSDFGRVDSSTSVSKASPSKKKRKSSGSKSSTRAIKPPSNTAGNAKKGSKDDDDSGGSSQLIDKFIKESPSISRPEVSDNTEDLSADSTAWNPEIASEYLAQIYLDQGNPKRAITIYEALSLKFPEKKSYFAGLIQEIKK